MQGHRAWWLAAVAAILVPGAAAADSFARAESLYAAGQLALGPATGVGKQFPDANRLGRFARRQPDEVRLALHATFSRNVGETHLSRTRPTRPCR